MRTLTRLTLTAALVSPSTARADVLDVRGPSPDHDQIAAAVAAAVDGDVIRIWGGVYEPFTIRGESLFLVSASPLESVLVAGTIRVRELSADGAVLLSGLDATGTDNRGIVVSGCLGSVRIHDGVFRGSANVESTYEQPGHPGGLFLNCRDVEVRGCTFFGGLPGTSFYTGAGGSGLEIEQSILSAFDSRFVGATGGFVQEDGGSGHYGGSGILARHPTGATSETRAYVAGCTLEGGDGGAASPYPDDYIYEYGYAGCGGAGFLHEGDVDDWFLDNVYLPGQSGWAPFPNHTCDPTPDTLGADGPVLPGSARLLHAQPLVVESSWIDFQLEGEHGDLVFLRSALAPSYDFDRIHGPVLVAGPPATPFGAVDPWTAERGWRSAGTVGHLGILHTSLWAGELPDLDHEVLHVQAIFVGAETYFSTATQTVVLDGAW